MGEENTEAGLVELYEHLPFMQDFPFEEYEILFEVEGTDIADSGISAILIEALGTFGTDNKIKFFYYEGEAKIMVTFVQETLLYLSAISPKVKKLNSVLDEIDEGLRSLGIEEKIDAIKKSRKFIKIVDEGNLFISQFETVLKEMMALFESKLTSNQVLGLQKINFKKIIEKPIHVNDREAILAYLNFQLHYAKILLGIVIAAKIH